MLTTSESTWGVKITSLFHGVIGKHFFKTLALAEQVENGKIGTQLRTDILNPNFSR